MIRLVEKPNGGLSDARNAGIRAARGEYILPLDSDDLLAPEFLEKTARLLEARADVAIAYTDVQQFGHRNDLWITHDGEPSAVLSNTRHAYCALYRREIWEAVGGYNTNMIWGYEDWDFWVGCFERGFKEAKVAEPLLRYRTKAESMYTRALEHDTELKAQIVLNHPAVYNAETRAWAEGVMAKAAAEARNGSQPSDPIHSALHAATIYFNKGDLTAAREALLQAQSLAPESPEIAEALGSVSFQLGDFSAAQVHFLKAAALAPENPDHQVKLALTALRLEQIDRFESALGRALTLDPQHRDALKLLADLNFQAAHWRDAEAGFTTLLSQTPDDQELLLQLAVCQFRQDKFDAAHHSLRRVLLLNPEHRLALENIQVVQSRLACDAVNGSGQVPSAIAACENSAQNNGHYGTAQGPEISVILPTYNRPEILARCLEGFAKQTLAREQFEIVIVDDGSNPPVQSTVDRFAGALLITYHFQANGGLAAARNACIERARAPLLALHDDDDVPAPDYLERCLEFHRAHPAEADILLARVAPHPDLEKTPLLEWIFDIENGIIGFPAPGVVHGFDKFFGGTSSCKKSIFSHGLYNPEYRFGYEDMELAFRLNQKLPLRVQYDSAVVSYLIREPDFAGLFRRSYREGRSFRRFFQHHGEAAFGLLPGDMNRSTEVVQVIGSKVSAILNLMQQIGCDGANTGVPLTIGHETYRGAEALKVCFSLCVKFARAQGWVDFAQGVDESAGLHRINACLDPQSIAKSARSQAAALPAKAAPAPGKKRALIYFHCNPYPPRSGAHRRAWNTMQGLLALGYEITLVSSDLFTDQPWTDDAVFGLRRDHGIEARVYFGSDEDREYIQNCGGSVWRVHTPPGLVQFFRNAFREISPELVLVNYAYCSEFVAAPEFAQSTCLIEMHDLVSLSQQMAQAAWAQLNGKIKPEFLDDAFFARLGLKADPEEYRRYDAVHGVICISSTETELVRTHAPNTAASYLPLAFEPKFVANSYSKGPILAIFTNAFNLQGYLWFTEKVLPQLLPVAKNFSLRIVGDACKVLPARPGTELLGFVPDLSQTYAESKYAICPLLGGTGQQVKIVEAMAHGLAVVAHKNVAASSPIEHGVNGFIAENAAQFTACVLKLERDPALCRQMGEAARRTIAEKFSQENYTKSLAQAIALANDKKSSTLTPQPSAVASAEIRKDRHELSTPIEAQSSIAPRSQLPVRWLAPFFNPSGYASEAINFVVPLAKRVQLGIQHNNRIYSEKFVAGLAEEERATLLALRDHFANLKGGIVISHTPAEGFQRLPDAQYNIGRTMFEVDRISPHWVSLCNQMDEIWVPSQFNLETFAASGVERDKLVVIPEAVNELEFNPEAVTPLPLTNRARFNFLSIFEWSSRKGWDVLLAAYLAEFSADDDVCLYLRTYLVNQPDGDPAEILWRRIRDFAATLNLGDKSWPRIELLAEQIPAADLPRLYKAVDCLVAPSRGEGWGRPHHEAMMMALPVIATHWSGTTEFLSGETAYLLDYTLAEAEGLEPELGHYRGFKWAEPSIGHLRQLMRQVRTHPEEARAKGQAARQHVLKHFSREPVADRIAERLQAIQTKLVTPSLPAVVAKPVLAPVEFPETKPQSVQVAWEGSFLDFGSLSLVNRELTRQLGRQPHLHVVCVGKNGIAPEHAEDRELQEMARRLRFEAPAKTQVTIRHAWPPNWQQPKQGAWIQMQPWEFGRLPKEWVAESGRVHEFWVYSEYVRRVYVDSGVDPSKVKVVPLGIDPARFHPEVPPLNLPSKKSFKFLFVGGTIGRKGTDVLLDTYLKQFTASDDVCLVIKDFGGRTVYNGQTLEAQIRASQTRPDAPEILYLNEELSTDQLPALYTACHCLVHPYRGEGFGLPVLEAMACGLPVIVTGGGATDDFATDEYAFRIPAVRKPIGTRVSEFELNGNGWLLEPCREALSKQLRWCFTHREEARIRGQAASAYVRQHWTWERSAQIASQRLQNLIARIDADAKAVATRRRRTAAPIVLPATAKIGNLSEARALLRERKFDSAWSATLAALDLRPFHPEAWLLLAEIAQSAGDIALARRCADRALQMVPKWKPARQLLKTLANAKANKSAVKLEFPQAGSASPKLTVCLIARNEEKFIGQCLRSVQGIAQQIVVVDTGSTDRTVEIARELGAEVYAFTWCDDFSAARNAALERARGEWVLVLDADEELLPASHAVLRSEMQCCEAIAYRLPIVDAGREEEGQSFVPRLFRNVPGLFYVSRVHEQVFASIEVRRKEWGMENRFGETRLLHHGYTLALLKSRDKIARNLRLLEKAIEDFPNDPSLLMNLGLELVRSGQFDQGIEQYIEAFEVMSAQPASEVVPELREAFLTQLTTHLLGAKRHAEIARYLNSPLARNGGLTASMHFILGLAHLELKQFADGAEQMRQVLAKRNRAALTPIHKGILKAGPHHCLGLALAALQKTSEAAAAFEAALAEEPQSRGLRFDYARFLAETGQLIEALKLTHVLVGEKPDELIYWQFGGHVALSQPDFIEFARDWTGEAIRQFPNHPAIVRQRAEALLLSQDATESGLLWQALASTHPSALAAKLLCDFVSGDFRSRVLVSDEPLVSQHFLKWYSHLARFGANRLLHQLNENQERWRELLPAAARLLDTALLEANR
ncbi:MAG: glycosyltransferase [Verrucomicrobiota bacterium]